MVTLVGVDKFMTGRMDFRLNMGLRASIKAGGSGREQLSMMELHGATQETRHVLL